MRPLATSLAQIFNSLRTLTGGSGDKQDPEVTQALLQAQELASSLQAGVFDLQKENLQAEAGLLKAQAQIAELEAENRKLQDRSDERKAYRVTQFRKGVVLMKDSEPDVPYCSTCGSEEHYVTLQPGGNRAYHHCPRCKNSVEVSQQEVRSRRSI